MTRKANVKKLNKLYFPQDVRARAKDIIALYSDGIINHIKKC